MESYTILIGIMIPCIVVYSMIDTSSVSYYTIRCFYMTQYNIVSYEMMRYCVKPFKTILDFRTF